MLMMVGSTPKDRLWQAAAAVAHAVAENADAIATALDRTAEGAAVADRIEHALEAWHTVAFEFYLELCAAPA